MIDEMLSRIKSVRKSLGLNQTDFARHLGLSQTSYSMIENGSRPIADRYIKVISLEFDINEHWLRTGQGEKEAISTYTKEFMEIFDSLTYYSRNYLLTVAKELLDLQEKLLETEE